MTTEPCLSSLLVSMKFLTYLHVKLVQLSIDCILCHNLPLRTEVIRSSHVSLTSGIYCVLCLERKSCTRTINSSSTIHWPIYSNDIRSSVLFVHLRKLIELCIRTNIANEYAIVKLGHSIGIHRRANELPGRQQQWLPISMKYRNGRLNIRIPLIMMTMMTVQVNRKCS
jgi:hypothetical protein